MNEHALDHATVEAGRQADRAIVERMIRRDRRLNRALATLAIGCWVLSVSVILSFYFMVMLFSMPLFGVLATEPAGTVDPRRGWDAIYQLGTQVGWPMAIVSAVLMVLAAVCTIWLVTSSRRATLRLVDQRLADILTELRRMQPHA